MALVPVSALLMAWGSLLPSPLPIFGLSLPPLTLMMILGIALTGVAECFLSPRFLECASKQAPAGQEGLYLGYAQLNTFFAWFAAFVLSGYLLDAFCPDPRKLGIKAPAEMPAAYAHAHYLWYVFAGIGAAAFVALLLFAAITRRLDARRAAGDGPGP